MHTFILVLGTQLINGYNTSCNYGRTFSSSISTMLVLSNKKASDIMLFYFIYIFFLVTNVTLDRFGGCRICSIGLNAGDNFDFINPKDDT